MLIYHPAFDAYHCVFRLLALTEMVSRIEVEKVRLLDFYLLFPSAIASIRLPQELKEARKLAKASANIYHDPINPATTFRDMHHIQEAALKCIAAAGFIDIKQFEVGFVVRTSMKIGDDLKVKVDHFLSSRQPITNVVVNHLASIPLRGHDGLKHRTELLEYKYDVA